jgi:hypothetical protein
LATGGTGASGTAKRRRAGDGATLAVGGKPLDSKKKKQKVVKEAKEAKEAAVKAKAREKAKAKAQANKEKAAVAAAIAAEKLGPYCVCRGPDNGTMMICCDGGFDDDDDAGAGADTATDAVAIGAGLEGGSDGDSDGENKPKKAWKGPCREWFHAACVGIAKDAAAPESYICPACCGAQGRGYTAGALPNKTIRALGRAGVDTDALIAATKAEVDAEPKYSDAILG